MSVWLHRLKDKWTSVLNHSQSIGAAAAISDGLACQLLSPEVLKVIRGRKIGLRCGPLFHFRQPQASDAISFEELYRIRVGFCEWDVERVSRGTHSAAPNTCSSTSISRYSKWLQLKEFNWLHSVAGLRCLTGASLQRAWPQSGH